MRALSDAIADGLDKPVRATIKDTSDSVRRLIATDRDLFTTEELLLKRQKEAAGEDVRRDRK